ncbi:hypothetical protein LQZ18_19440 [Lachnospiraceae bacterium ZAX-1]
MPTCVVAGDNEIGRHPHFSEKALVEIGCLQTMPKDGQGKSAVRATGPVYATRLGDLWLEATVISK